MHKLKWRFIPFLAMFFAVGALFAQTTKIDLSLKNSTLKEFIKAIEEKTDYTFMLDNTIDQTLPVSLTAKQEALGSLLDKALDKKKYSYEIAGKQIVLKLKQADNNQRSTKKISGIIKDEKGEPIIGVSVSVKGTTIGTMTGIDGTFTLDNVDENTLLQISYIGYLPQNIQISSKTKTEMNITLVENTKLLDEVVVVGFGTQKKVNLTGAVESIKAENIVSKPVSSVTQALTGEAAGVTVIQRSSKPGAYDEFIRIRGVGTWGDANPLVLVDGVEMGLDKVNPSDVENISILKDAAAASIYGSRAGNGVVLVSTKKGGKEGKPQINISTNWGVQVITRMTKKLNALDYSLTFDKSLTNDNRSPKFTAEIAAMKEGKWDPDRLIANTDWLDEVTHPALQQNHNISVSGATNTTSYLVSTGYLNQKSVVGDNTSFDRYNARLNTRSSITNWFKLDANMAYMASVAREPAPGVTDIIKQALNAESYLPARFSDGTWVKPGIGENPLRMATTSDFGTQKNNKSNFTGLLSPEISFYGFTFKTLFSYEKQVEKLDKFTKTLGYEEFKLNDKPIQSASTSISDNKKEDDWIAFENITANATLTYEKTFGSHSIKVLAGMSRERYRREETKSSMSGYPSNDLDAIGAGTEKPSINGGFGYNALASYFGRINYSFRDRYLFEANIRRDGSSKFSQDNRWGSFPSISLGWRVSEESFFEPLKSVVDNLKLRGSYGKLGNNRIDSYKFLSTIKANKDDGYVLGGNTISSIYYEDIMGNPYITWEKLESTNVGLDLALLRNRLSLTADYFNRTTKDILLDLPAPGTLGIKAPTANAAVVENKGWELTLNWKDQIGALKYDLSFNISDVQNKVVDLKGYKAPTNKLEILREGDPINAIFGWKSIGICRTQEDYAKYKEQMASISTKFGVGDIVYEDINKDKKIDGNDKTIIGNQIPRYTYGFRLGMKYKDLDFSCFFQGVSKVDGYLSYETQNSLYNIGNSFDPIDNPNAEFPRLMPNSINYYNYSSYSSFWVENASYLRLKNIQLGYTFNNLQKYKISNLRAFFTAENILTITKFRGFDPESSVGMRGWMYPLVGVYSLGLNLSF